MIRTVTCEDSSGVEYQASINPAVYGANDVGISIDDAKSSSIYYETNKVKGDLGDEPKHKK